MHGGSSPLRRPAAHLSAGLASQDLATRILQGRCVASTGWKGWICPPTPAHTDRS